MFGIKKRKKYLTVPSRPCNCGSTDFLRWQIQSIQPAFVCKKCGCVYLINDPFDIAPFHSFPIEDPVLKWKEKYENL